MLRRSFLQAIGAAIGGALLGKYLPPAAAAPKPGGFLVPADIASELIRVLSITIEQDQLDVTTRGAEPEYQPGLRRWYGELELLARGLPRDKRGRREVMSWLRGQTPIPISMDVGGRRIEGKAVASSYTHRAVQPDVLRVQFEGSGALTMVAT